MKVNPILSNSASFSGKKFGKARTAAILAAAMLTPSVAPKASAEIIPAQSISYNYTITTSADDSRVVKNSDLYYAILSDGGKNKIRSHYDPGKNGIGSYYQYGNNAYTKAGAKIANPEKLYGFKTEYKSSSSNNSSTSTTNSDFARAFLKYGNKYEVEVCYDSKIGAYYSYAGKAYDANGKEITVPKSSQSSSQQKKGGLWDSDYGKVYAIYGDLFPVEEHYDSKIGTYYTYAGKTYDPKGNEIYVPKSSQSSSQQKKGGLWDSDYGKVYAIYGDLFPVEKHYDSTIGTYYTYAGRTYDPNGKEITVPKSSYSQQKKGGLWDSDYGKLYAIYGDLFTLEAHYDSKIGVYYTYAGKTFDPNGKEIYVPKSSCKQSDTKNLWNSDYGRLYAIYGDLYTLEAHYDSKIGLYYRYAARAFDPNGKEIQNPATQPLPPFNENEIVTPDIFDFECYPNFLPEPSVDPNLFNFEFLTDDFFSSLFE